MAPDIPVADWISRIKLIVEKSLVRTYQQGQNSCGIAVIGCHSQADIAVRVPEVLAWFIYASCAAFS